MPLALATEPAADPSSATLRVSGELDLATAPGLRAAVGDLMGQGVRHVELDLAGCTFLDSSGLGALLWASHRLEAAGGEVTVVHAGSGPAKTLALSGVDRVMAVHA